MHELFQSTFPRGERQYGVGTLYKFSYFNPRSRVGNDNTYPINIQSLCISIHVPAWGTTVHMTASDVHSTFQSTFPRGERPHNALDLCPDCIFQSTFPRGERPLRVMIPLPSLCYFNPRSRVGNDAGGKAGDQTGTISIHVPAWGTTRQEYNDLKGKYISIHVPAWGTT